MFTNSVTSAVGRLYAVGVAEAPRLQVQRVEPVTRVAPVASEATAERDQIDEKTHRQALAGGVRAVFESTVIGDAELTSIEAEDPVERAAEESAETKSASNEPMDPLLEEAILRFIHSVFRGIAEAEGVGDLQGALSWQTSGEAGGPRTPNGSLRGASASREQLGRRIVSFADHLARAGAVTDPLATVGVRDAELGKTFTSVVKALGSRIESTVASQPTRGDLVTLMHRLAHAVQGSPPLDDGLPTLGGLLHARA